MFLNFCFEDLDLRRINNSIVYFGKADKDTSIAGVINDSGFGEEIIITSQVVFHIPDIVFKKHKIRRFKTKLHTEHFKSEYFTKSCLANITRTIMF